MYENIFGLSCVENQVLAILKQCGEKITLTYHDCAVPVEELFASMIKQNLKREYFNQIQRVQDLLKNLGVISFVRQPIGQIDEFLNMIRSCRENEYILMRTTTSFAKEVLMTHGFRSDHYALVKAAADHFIIYNDIPEREVTLSARDMAEICDGDYFKLTILRKMNHLDAEFLWDKRKYKPETQKEFCLNHQDLDGIDDISVRLRDMVGVYKLLRYRMAEYYGLYMDTQFITDMMSDIEKYYAISEYYNLKKNVVLGKFFSLFCDLNHTDIVMMKEIKNRLERVKDVKSENR